MNYSSEILRTCATFRLDPDLVAAQVHVESSGDAFAWNPEPAYRYLWNVTTHAPFRRLTHAELEAKQAPHDFPALGGDPDQEWWAQQASWGLMQIMGAVAREHEFRGVYLTELTDPVVNLTIGCSHLAGLIDWAAGDVAKALAAYNAGKGGYKSAAGQAYAARVLAARKVLIHP